MSIDKGKRKMFLTEIKGQGSSKYEVYVDMDGVIADFEAKVKEVFGKEISDIPTSQLWKGVSRYNKTVEPFFETLPAMHDAKDLIRYVDENFSKWHILTAGGFVPKNVAEQKKKWIAKVISPQVDVIVVKRSNEKAEYANENAILVDDRMKAIGPWRSAGGIGILHTSASDSIQQLSRFVK